MNRTFLFLLPWLLAARLTAQAPMTLQACIEYALVNHPDIKLAELSISDADWQIKENSSIAYPQVNLGIDLQRFLQVPAIPAEALGFPGDDKVRFSLENNFSGSITVSQILVNFPYFESIKAAREFKTLVQLQMNSTREDVANRVRDAYLPALLITETVSVLDKDIALQQKLADETRATLKAGFVEQIDVDRLDLIVGTIRTERENLVRQREILIDALKFTMGYPILDSLVLADNMDILMADIADIDPTERLDYMNRPDYQVVLKARELRQIQIDAADKAWLPTLNAFGSYNPTLQGNDELYYIPSALVGLQINMPIIDGGLKRARRERAEIDAMRVDEQKRLLMSGLDVETEAARKNLISTKLKMDEQQVNLDLATRIQDVTETKFRAGLASSFEVTQSYSTLFSAQRSMLQARYNYLAAIMKWREALGKATPAIMPNN
jgi:outer membrane protein TolC